MEILKDQLAVLRAEKGQRQARSDKYFMFFPTDGPNNQLYGFKVLLPLVIHHRKIIVLRNIC
jgi:hypothetical protein